MAVMIKWVKSAAIITGILGFAGVVLLIILINTDDSAQPEQVKDSATTLVAKPAALNNDTGTKSPSTDGGNTQKTPPASNVDSMLLVLKQGIAQEKNEADVDVEKDAASTNAVIQKQEAAKLELAKREAEKIELARQQKIAKAEAAKLAGQKQEADQKLKEVASAKEENKGNKNTARQMSDGELNNVINTLNATREALGKTGKCVHVRWSGKANQNASVQLENFLKTKGYVMAGRSNAANGKKGISADAYGSCIRLTVGI